MHAALARRSQPLARRSQSYGCNKKGELSELRRTSTLATLKVRKIRVIRGRKRKGGLREAEK